MEAPNRPAHQRTRSRGLSFKSEKSGSGSYKQPKVKVDNLRESAEDKRKNHLSLGTKANPNAAMNEAQPVAAALEKSTLASLREIQHLDTHGNLIAEPDLSNPTRPRWERPLDTIRSFDRAIDNEYRRKTTITRQEAFGDGGFASRRSSYYGGYGDQYQQPQARYSRASSFYGGNAPRDSYADYGQSPQGHPSRNRFGQRMHSDIALNRYSSAPNQPYPAGQPVYPHQGYQQSRDTVNTGVSSGSQSEPWGNSTDPSSENSSVDRINATQKQYVDPNDQYGYGARTPIHENGEYAYPQPPSRGRPLNGNYYQQQNQYGAPPPVPPHASKPENARPPPMKLGGPPMPARGQGAPMPLGQTSGNTRPSLQASDSKRKSWFKRRFSKD